MTRPELDAPILGLRAAGFPGQPGRQHAAHNMITPVLAMSTHRSGPLRKRWAVLTMVTVLHKAGVTAHQLATVLPRSRFLSVEGVLSGDELAKAFLATYPGPAKRLGRWFLDAPLHEQGCTWVVSKMWGTNTEPVLDRLVALAPTPDFSYQPFEPDEA